MFILEKPLNEGTLRRELIALAGEDGIEVAAIDIEFKDEEPNDWPTSGSFPIDVRAPFVFCVACGLRCPDAALD